MKKLFYLAIVAAALTATSCATAFCGSKKTITLDSNIPVESAKLTIDGHKYNNVSFPYVVKVKRGFNETIVKAEAEGYTPTTLVIDKNIQPRIGSQYFGNGMVGCRCSNGSDDETRVQLLRIGVHDAATRRKPADVDNCR